MKPKEFFSKAGCVHEGTFYTPIHWLRRDTREVVLLGTCHLGEPGYYTELRKTIRSLEQRRFVVLYEMVNLLTKSQKRRLTKEEAASRKKLHEQMAKVVQFELPKLLDLVYQAQQLPSQSSWIRTDVTELEMIRDKKYVDRQDGQKTVDPMRQQTVQQNRAYILGELITALKKAKVTSLDKERNRIGYEGITSQVTEGRDVLAIWGVLHLPGLLKLLENDKFQLVKTELIPVFSVS